MNFYSAIKDLYKDNKVSPLIVINKSKYVPDLKDLDDSGVVHTGFYFPIHTGAILEILYDLNNNLILRQPRNENYPLPSIAGLLYKKQGKYLNCVMNKIVTEISVCNNFIKIEDFDSCAPLKTNSIRFFTQNQEGKIYTDNFPLSMIYPKSLYFDGQKFHLHQPIPKFEDDDEPSSLNFLDRQQMGRDNFNTLTDGQLGSYDDFDGDIDDVMRYLGRD